MADTNPNSTDKHVISKTGERYQAVVTRYFDDMDRAVQWAESTYTTNPFPNEPNGEPAASDMTPEDAEKLNSNVNPAPIPAGAEQVLSGGSPDNTGEPKTEVVPAAPIVDNTAAGTHDPDLTTETTQVPNKDQSSDTSSQSIDNSSK